jgi:hypothetical protein
VNCALPHALTVTLQILVRTSLFITHPAKPGTHCRCRPRAPPPMRCGHVSVIFHHSISSTRVTAKHADHRCTEQSPPFTDFRFSELKIQSSDRSCPGVQRHFVNPPTRLKPSSPPAKPYLFVDPESVRCGGFCSTLARPQQTTSDYFVTLRLGRHILAIDCRLDLHTIRILLPFPSF